MLPSFVTWPMRIWVISLSFNSLMSLELTSLIWLALPGRNASLELEMDWMESMMTSW